MLPICIPFPEAIDTVKRVGAPADENILRIAFNGNERRARSCATLKSDLAARLRAESKGQTSAGTQADTATRELPF